MPAISSDILRKMTLFHNRVVQSDRGIISSFERVIANLCEKSITYYNPKNLRAAPLKEIAKLYLRHHTSYIFGRSIDPCQIQMLQQALRRHVRTPWRTATRMRLLARTASRHLRRSCQSEVMRSHGRSMDFSACKACKQLGNPWRDYGQRIPSATRPAGERHGLM